MVFPFCSAWLSLELYFRLMKCIYVPSLRGEPTGDDWDLGHFPSMFSVRLVERKHPAFTYRPLLWFTFVFWTLMDILICNILYWYQYISHLLSKYVLYCSYVCQTFQFSSYLYSEGLFINDSYSIPKNMAEIDLLMVVDSVFLARA